MKLANNKFKNLGIFLLIIFIAGTGWWFLKKSVSEAGIGMTMFIRFTIASAIFGIYGFIKKERLSKKLILHSIVFGIITYAICLIFIVKSFDYISTGLVSCIVAMASIPNIIFAKIMLKKKVINRHIYGTIVMMLGIYLVFHNLIMLNQSATIYLGVLYAILALFCDGFGFSYISKYMEQERKILFQSCSMLTAAVIFFIYSFYDGSFIKILSNDISKYFWYYSLYIGIVLTALLYGLYITLVTTLNNVNASYVWYYVPLIAILHNTINATYNFTIFTAFGIFFLILGGYVIKGGHLLKIKKSYLRIRNEY